MSHLKMISLAEWKTRSKIEFEKDKVLLSGWVASLDNSLHRIDPFYAPELGHTANNSSMPKTDTPAN